MGTPASSDQIFGLQTIAVERAPSSLGRRVCLLLRMFQTIMLDAHRRSCHAARALMVLCRVMIAEQLSLQNNWPQPSPIFLPAAWHCAPSAHHQMLRMPNHTPPFPNLFRFHAKNANAAPYPRESTTFPAPYEVGEPTFVKW